MKYRFYAGILLASIFALTAFQTYIPLLYRDLIAILAKGVTREGMRAALGLVFFILAMNFVKTWLWRGSNFVNNRFQPAVMRDLMNTCYQHLQRHSAGFFNSSFVGSLVAKVKRYERSFEQIADQIVYDFGRSFLDAAMIVGVLLWQYRDVGFIVLAWCVIFMLFSYFYARFKLPYDARRAAADTQTTAQLADSITNNVNIKLFTNYKKEDERFQEVTREQFLIRKKSWDLSTIGDIIQSSFMIGLEFGIIYFAVKLWARGMLSVADIVLLQVYLMRIFDKLWNTGKYIRNIYEALADANEMTAILSEPYEVRDAADAKPLVVVEGNIEFRGVSFGYHRESPVFKDFNFTAASGERVAFVGPSGGGKSTIAKLLFRFYNLDGGEIMIDGQNIAGVTQDSLRAAIALVPQDPILFHRSLMENIRYARPEATDDEVVTAAKLAHAHEFIESFPKRYDTLVGERGLKLSGGERQRVAIARAILKNAPILVLDEATSSLDSESELYIQDALRRLMEGRTTIVIAHRLSTIMQMDRIVVIESGRVVEEGKHKELVKAKKGIYQRLWEIQAGGFATI